LCAPPSGSVGFVLLILFELRRLAVLCFRVSKFRVVWICAQRFGKFGFNFITNKVLFKSFYKGQFPHKSVNLSFIVTDIKDKLTDLCGN